MGVLAEIVLPPAELDDADLLALALLQDPGAYAGAGQERAADLHVGALANQQDFVEFDIGAFVGIESLDPEDLAFARTVLLTAGAKNRVHFKLLQ